MKRFFAVWAVAVLMLFCCGCAAGGPQSFKVQNVDTVMGTVLQQTLYISDRETPADQEIALLLRKLEEERLSRRLETSEVSRLNQAAGEDSGSAVSDFLEEVLKGCLEIWQKSGGAFDITLGAVVSLWDIDGWASGENQGVFAPPRDEQLRKALESCGCGRMKIEGGRLYLPEGMELDLGAVGKGIALDQLLVYLREKNEITGAVISLGGSILTYGQKPDGESWSVGIADPEDTASIIGTLTLEGEWFVSTSGDYERYAEADGIRYHHIIDPATGYPADSGVRGVTILAKEGFLSDALSTACFILGEEKGMELAAGCGVEVLFVGKDGGITMSEGMKAYFTAAADHSRGE